MNGQSSGAVFGGSEGGRRLQLSNGVEAAADDQLLAELEERDHRIFGQTDLQGLEMGVDDVGLSLPGPVQLGVDWRRRRRRAVTFVAAQDETPSAARR